MEKEYPEFNCDILTTKPQDFDETWERWKKEVHDVPNHIEIVKDELTPYGKRIEFYYDSVANTKIFAILYLRWDSPKPVIAYYHGHGSCIEDEWNVWHCVNLLDAGFSVVAIDMRFQSKKVVDNNTYEFTDYPSCCYNITDLETCYNKRLDQDALKIIDVITDPKVFPETAGLGVMVAGPSQGGGLSMMVSAMSDYPLLCSLSDVPSDCALKDRILGRYGKYTPIDDLIKAHPNLKEQVLANQDYFDVVNMADKIKCPIITSVGMDDNICPPRFFYQAYKQIRGEKELYPYPGYGHGGFEEKHLPLKIAFANKHLK